MSSTSNVTFGVAQPKIIPYFSVVGFDKATVLVAHIVKTLWLGNAHELTLEVVGPPMERTHQPPRVPGTVSYLRSAVATEVEEHPDRSICAPDEKQRVVDNVPSQVSVRSGKLAAHGEEHGCPGEERLALAGQNFRGGVRLERFFVCRRCQIRRPPVDQVEHAFRQIDQPFPGPWGLPSSQRWP